MLSQSELSKLLKTSLPKVDLHDLVIEEVEQNSFRMRLPMRDQFVSHDLPAGSGQIVVSGPLMMGFADTVMYACIHAAYGTKVFAAMVNFNVTFLRIAGAADLIGQARLLRAGKTLAFVEAELFSSGDTALCARVSATYAIRRAQVKAGVRRLL